jgi:hypothetical protein
MRKMGLVVIVVGLWAAPRPASAGWVLEGSFGVPWQTSPNTARQQLNLMVTPGYGFMDNFLRLELGLVANFADVQNSKFNVGLRPMVAVHPPIVPVYGKLIFDWNDIGGDTSTASIGGAIGVSFGLGPAALFLEGDYLPRSVASTNLNVLEARAGLSFEL